MARNRLGVTAVHAQYHPDSEVRLLEVRRDPQRRLELLDGARGIAGHHQGCPQPVPQRGIARGLGQPLAEDRRCRVEPPGVHGPHAPDLVRESAPQQAVVRLHQRVRRRRHALAPPLQMRPGRVEVAQRPVRHAQVIVQAGSRRRDRQRAFEVPHRPPRIARRQGRAPGAGQGRGRGRIDGQRPLERGARRGRTPAVELHAPEPDQGRQVARLQCEGAAIEVRRTLAVTPLAVQVGEIVGPAHGGSRQPVRVPQGDLGPVPIVGGHQDEAERAVGVSQRGRRRPGIVRRGRHGGVPFPQLRLHRRGQSREVGPIHGLRPGPVERTRAGQTRPPGTRRPGAAAGRGQGDGHQEPGDRQGSPPPAPRPRRSRAHCGSPPPCRSVL